MKEVLADFHFLRPAWLLLLPLVIGLWWLWQRRSDPLHGWRRQMDATLLNALSVGRDRLHDRDARWLLVGWILATIAIAGPTWRPEPNPFVEDAQPLMVLLKADQSMNRTPPEPNRLERAQLKIKDLAALRRGQPLGLIAYAGSAHLVLPPTRDTEIVAQMAAEIGPSVMPVPGDRLDLAIRKAAEVLDGSDGDGSLLVITDSVEQAPNQVAQAVSTGTRRPILFLAVTGQESPETDSIRQAAAEIDARIQPLTVDDTDLEAIRDFAERRAAGGVAGESSRWQEAGYWLTPLLALIVALSFRREQLQTEVKET
ncbi:VWA domain-containing protein [Roseiconus nitratireducens]|uniref:VWA domain-containing protein n=1 Tax=Roseiconus nitratireducens TaxID=2605748 RepID=A0A5M6DIA3_9BACT|nr:VWA domain-containing protein [Roseiconus nitratireducens]KAA5547284.1 VWA domain-containing protein [Roseiconus nitratireducens]